jgi:hypothetical protein
VMNVLRPWVALLPPRNSVSKSVRSTKFAASPRAAGLTHHRVDRIVDGDANALFTQAPPIDPLAASRATLHPALADFYASLDEEQKARIVVNFSSGNDQAKPDRDSRVAVDFDNQQNADQEPVCRQWASILRSWPTRQIEAGTSLSDEQHADLYEVTAAFYHAAAGLVSSCPVETPLTPLGRLDAEEKQLAALRRGIDTIQPVITTFQNSLTDAQKTRLDAVVNDSTGPKPVRVNR